MAEALNKRNHNVHQTLITLSAVIIVAITSQVVAKDGGVPEIDLDKRCQSSQRATEEMLGTARPDTFGSCMKTEKEARELLIKVWETAPAAVKALCAQPTGYSPSYVEWITCGEMARDVKKMRQEQPVSIRTNTLCPIVQYLQDGSVSSVAACRIPMRPLY